MFGASERLLYLLEIYSSVPHQYSSDDMWLPSTLPIFILETQVSARNLYSSCVTSGSEGPI